VSTVSILATRGELTVTPHPILEAIVEHHLLVFGNCFFVQGVMEDPQPVSINELYTTYRGKKNLTAKGRAYRDGMAQVVARSSMDWKRAHDMVYQRGGGATLLVALYFAELNNKSWKPGGKTKKGLLSEPRKVQDASNYIKIIEDGVAQGCGINDCNNISVLATKAEDKLRPRTELIYIVHPV
jgi:hypothetical protein